MKKRLPALLLALLSCLALLVPAACAEEAEETLLLALGDEVSFYYDGNFLGTAVAEEF